MGALVKLDEDLSPIVAGPLRDAGYEVRTVVGQGWSGLPDEDLWQRVSAESAFSITADKGFGNIRHFPPGTHHGILLLRPGRESLVEYRSLVAEVIAQIHLDQLAACVSVATPGGLRVRRHPPGADGN